jgi:uncharacterized protein YdhG (YjbR/CyaY superfamily)
MAAEFSTVDDYIASFPDDIQQILTRVRVAIHSQIPDADEKIRYDMPAVMLGGRYALHFAAWKKHVGLYPVPVGDAELERELAAYRSGKDSVNFVYTAPIRYDLIERIAKLAIDRRSAT